MKGIWLSDKEIGSYCGSVYDDRVKHGKIFIAMGVICFVFMILFLWAAGLFSLKPRDWIIAFGWLFLPFGFLFCGAVMIYNSSIPRVKRRLRKYKRQGILNEMISDYVSSESMYNDRIRLGNHHIFGSSWGEFGPLNRISGIRRYEFLYYLDGKLIDERRCCYIQIKYRNSLKWKVLTNLSIDDIQDENKWKSFCEELRFRNKSIFYAPEIKWSIKNRYTLPER